MATHSPLPTSYEIINNACDLSRGSVVFSTSAWHAAVPRVSILCLDKACYIRCKNLALTIRDCISLSFGGDTKSRRSLLSGAYVRGSKRGCLEYNITKN